MKNQFHTFLGVLPTKETIEFVKNVAFVIGLQTVALVLATPHKGTAVEWSYYVLAGAIILPSGILSAMVVSLFLDNFENVPGRTRALVYTLAIAAIFVAGQATKIRIAEGW